MNLKDKTLIEKQQLTAQYPALIVGAAGNGGKTYALENMSAEDKKRTMVLNFDSKPVGIDQDEFAAVFAVAADQDKLVAQMNALPKEAKEYKAHFKKVLATSYFIDDPEAIDKICDHIMKASFSDKIDRIVIDTATALIDFCESWSQSCFSGRESWARYGEALKRVQQASKEAVIFGFKYVYVNSHTPFIPSNLWDTTAKEVIAVKGGIMKNNFETGYNTVIFAHADEEGVRWFEADNNNGLDTSRTKVVEGKFKFKRNSLDDLEQLFAGTKKVVNDELMDI